MILLFGLLACNRPCELDAAITPGCGVEVGETSIRLLDSIDDIELGTPTPVDLGPEGQWLGWPSASVAVWPDDDRVGAIWVLEGFDGATPDGLRVGEAGTPSGTQDDWTGTSWSSGLGVSRVDDRVVWMVVYPHWD